MVSFSLPNRISLQAFLTVQNALRNELKDDPCPLQQLMEVRKW